MNVLRYLIFILLGYLFYLFIKRLINKPDAAKPQKRAIENMVRCEVCGLHVPEQEAIHVGEHHYCSQEHQRQSGQ